MKKLCFLVAVALSVAVFAGCMSALPERTKDQLATGVVVRCETLSYAQRLADREDFAKRTHPHRAIVQCYGDPDYPASDGGAD